MKPTLHLTNWSSTRLHGPGRKLTIMAAPRAWERGDGAVVDLTPSVEDLRAVKAGTITMAEYRGRFLALRRGWLVPGDSARTRHEPGCSRQHGARMYECDCNAFMLRMKDGTPVDDGDSLLCACSRAEAALGRCHRVWAADLLVGAGWRVMLDGVEHRVGVLS